MKRSQAQDARSPLALVLLGVLALLVGVLFLVFGRDGTSDPDLERPNDRGSAVRKTASSPASGKNSESGDELGPDRVELAPAAPARSKNRELSIVAIRSDIMGRVRGAELSFVPLTPKSVQVIKDGTRGYFAKAADQETIKAVTDSRGEARVTLLADSVYLIQAKARGLLSLGLPTLLGPKAEELRVAFSEFLRVEGRVLAPDGAGLSGARLYFCARTMHLGQNPEVGSTGFAQSDSTGRFVLETKKQVWGVPHVSVAHPDYPTLVEPVPPMRTSSYLLIQMEHGIRFRFRILDSLGEPIPGTAIRVTQGLYTELLSCPPGGPELGGSSKGLKILLNQKANKNGFVAIRGWPKGVPAWFQVFTPIDGARARPRWDFKRAEPYKGKPLPWLFEVTPNEGQLYDILVDTKDRTFLAVQGKAAGLSDKEKKAMRVYMEYGEGYRRVLYPVHWDGDSFRTRLDYIRTEVTKNMPPDDRRLRFRVKVCVNPYSKAVQIFGPYQLRLDRNVVGLRVQKHLIFPPSSDPKPGEGSKSHE